MSWHNSNNNNINKTYHGSNSGYAICLCVHVWELNVLYMPRWEKFTLITSLFARNIISLKPIVVQRWKKRPAIPHQKQRRMIIVCRISICKMFNCSIVDGTLCSIAWCTLQRTQWRWKTLSFILVPPCTWLCEIILYSSFSSSISFLVFSHVCGRLEICCLVCFFFVLKFVFVCVCVSRTPCVSSRFPLCYCCV